MEPSDGIRVASVLGTSRPGNYTGMALRVVEDQLVQRGVTVDAIDPATLSLAFPGQTAGADAERLRERVDSATAVVLATPEYHGSFAAMLKLVIENLGFPSVLAGKPVALLGVAAGRIGAIKSLEQLRGVCSHVGALVLPAPRSLASVQTLFDDQGNCTDERTEKLLRSLADSLVDYIHRHICPVLTLEGIVRGEIDPKNLAIDS